MNEPQQPDDADSDEEGYEEQYDPTDPQQEADLDAVIDEMIASGAIPGIRDESAGSRKDDAGVVASFEATAASNLGQKDCAASKESAYTGDIRELCTTVGLVAIYWSLVERQIDNVVTVALALAPKPKKRPMQLAVKVKLLQSAFAEIAALKRYAERAGGLLDEAKNHARIRNAFMHGVISKIESNVITLHRVQQMEGPYYSITVDEINAQALADFITGMQHLSMQWMSFAHELLPLCKKVRAAEA